jgi:hypothetical protein
MMQVRDVVPSENDFKAVSRKSGRQRERRRENRFSRRAARPAAERVGRQRGEHSPTRGRGGYNGIAGGLPYAYRALLR